MATPEPSDTDREGLAAEYALGTLDVEEIAMARRLLATDADFARDVARWRSRLDPLLDAIPDIEAPAYVREAVLAAVARSGISMKPESIASTPLSERSASPVIDLSKDVRFWRRTAIVTSALAASLVAFIAVRAFMPAESTQFVAVLENAQRQPAFVASVDVNRRTIAIKKLAPPPGAGKSYELWAIDGEAAPASLGIVDENVGVDKNRLINANVTNAGPALTLAVTVEPQGGSPNGKPSGAPIYIGVLVQAPDR